MTDSPIRYTFPARMRLSSRRAFDRVYSARARRGEGSLLIYAAPNELAYSRIGISISRRVGIAARRNRIKRLVREAFRHNRHRFPAGLDIVVVVRPHEPSTVETYAADLDEALSALALTWQRRRSR